MISAHLSTSQYYIESFSYFLRNQIHNCPSFPKIWPSVRPKFRKRMAKNVVRPKIKTNQCFSRCHNVGMQLYTESAEIRKIDQLYGRPNIRRPRIFEPLNFSESKSISVFDREYNRIDIKSDIDFVVKEQAILFNCGLNF